LIFGALITSSVLAGFFVFFTAMLFTPVLF